MSVQAAQLYKVSGLCTHNVLPGVRPVLIRENKELIQHVTIKQTRDYNIRDQRY